MNAAASHATGRYILATMTLRTQPTLAVLRRVLLLILWVGLLGTQIELLLLKHTDGRWQLFPVVATGAAIVVLVWYGISQNAASLRTLNALMILFLIAGMLGVYQHFVGNVAYERDSDPSLSGRALYESAVMGATPTLAPGVMIQLGLIGLAFAFRHPGLKGSAHDDDVSSTRNDS